VLLLFFSPSPAGDAGRREEIVEKGQVLKKKDDWRIAA